MKFKQSRQDKQESNAFKSKNEYQLVGGRQNISNYILFKASK